MGMDGNGWKEGMRERRMGRGEGGGEGGGGDRWNQRRGEINVEITVCWLLAVGSLELGTGLREPPRLVFLCWVVLGGVQDATAIGIVSPDGEKTRTEWRRIGGGREWEFGARSDDVVSRVGFGTSPAAGRASLCGRDGRASPAGPHARDAAGTRYPWREPRIPRRDRRSLRPTQGPPGRTPHGHPCLQAGCIAPQTTPHRTHQRLPNPFSRSCAWKQRYAQHRRRDRPDRGPTVSSRIAPPLVNVDFVRAAEQGIAAHRRRV